MFKGQNLFLSALILLLAHSAFAADDFFSRAVEDYLASTTVLPSELKYSYNWWQPMVGAKSAYATGMRGAGVTVAIVDTGLNVANAEFKGRVATGYNAFTKTSNVADDNGHGTHVAGIIGAAAGNGLMVGIAPEVTLQPIKVLSGSGEGSYSSLSGGMAYASSHGARIINLSLGGGSPAAQQIFKNATDAGKLLVVAAGNDGALNPDYPAQFAKESWANNRIIAVGAVGAGGTIASYSNRAGNTAAHFVVAPGTNIVSTFGSNQYAYMSGTSMATPVVSGVAADLFSRWSYLKAEQVASIIFQSATHLGKSAANVPDSIYGWGLVNLTKALQPIGNPQVASATGGSKALASSLLATNNLLTAKAFSGLSLVATDDFGRAYAYELGAFARQPEAASLATLFANLDRQMAMVTRSSPTASLTLALYGGPAADNADPIALADLPRVTLGGFNYLQNHGSGEFALGSNGFAEQYFGLGADYRGIPLRDNFANPFLRLAGASSHLAAGYALGAGYKLKVGVLNGANPLAGQAWLETAPAADGWLAEVEKRFAAGVARASLGALAENGTMLGAAGSAAFAMEGARTNFLALSGAYDLTEKNVLLAQVATGSTELAGNGLFNDGEARTIGWSLGLHRRDSFREGDQLAISLSQPLRVVSGKMGLLLPTVDGSGVGGFAATTVDLAGERTETDFEVGYMAPLAKNSALYFNAAYKQNVANSAGDAAVVGLRYTLKF